MNNIQNYIASAFVSCSLHEVDKPFVQFIEQILLTHNIRPFGTVGHFSASPINTAVHMKQNIPIADLVVIIATPRYLQIDLKSGKISYGISEMVHVETGMAYMAGKPVIVFVQEGTDVGKFLQNITQYIVLNGNDEDTNQKWNLINSLMYNAYNIIRQIRDQAANKAFWNALKTGLAIIGGATIIDSLTAKDKPKRKRATPRRKTSQSNVKKASR